MEKDRLLTAREVADILRIHPLTPYEWSKTGKLSAIRISSRSVRFRESEVKELMEKGASR